MFFTWTFRSLISVPAALKLRIDSMRTFPRLERELSATALHSCSKALDVDLLQADVYQGYETHSQPCRFHDSRCSVNLSARVAEAIIKIGDEQSILRC